MKMSIADQTAKDRILDAAEDLMARHGFAGTSMSLLCKKVKHSPSSIYWHFGSKEGVMAAMLERGITRYLDATDAVKNRSGNDPAEALATLFEEIEKQPQSLRLAIILGMEEGPDGGIGGAKVSLVRMRGRQIIIRIVAQMLGVPETDAKAQELGMLALSALDGAVVLERLDGIPITTTLKPLIKLLNAAHTIFK